MPVDRPDQGNRHVLKPSRPSTDRIAAPHVRIAVYVDERQDGWFQWVLIEQLASGSEWAALSSAEHWFKTYHQAMAAGLLELQGLVDDLDVGPRKAHEAKTSQSKADLPY